MAQGAVRQAHYGMRSVAPPAALTTLDASGSVEAETIARVSRRLLPILFFLFVVAFVDRTNVGLAALQMNDALGLSAAVYGLGAGIFFVGYALFELPSNLILARVGARRWIGRIALSWGVLACAMMFVRGPRSFYVLRFLLGVAEAGYFPGIIFYLSEWFPEAQRARALSRFMIAIPLAGVIGGPLAAGLLSLDRLVGLAGWQWLFLVEGLPAIALGVFALFYLTDSPADAAWLSDAQREWLASRLRAERRARVQAEQRLAAAITSPALWAFTIAYLLAIAAELGPILFGPVLIKDAMHASDAVVGWIMGAIGAVGVLAMLFTAARSDRTNERVMHSVLPMLVVAAGFGVSALAARSGWIVLGFAIVACGINGFLPAFWCLPLERLSGTAAAGGIAIINSIGNLGGYVAPAVLGASRSASGSYEPGLLALGGLAFVCALIVLSFRRSVPSALTTSHGS